MIGQMIKMCDNALIEMKGMYTIPDFMKLFINILTNKFSTIMTEQEAFTLACSIPHEISPNVMEDEERYCLLIEKVGDLMLENIRLFKNSFMSSHVSFESIQAHLSDMKFTLKV